MKTKYFIGITSLLLLAGSTLNGQSGDSRGYRNNDAPLVINNYYNDYDYSFASRINRFHRSYVVFDYYNPFFNDPYWYDYQPYSLGINIYSGFGFGLGNYWGYSPYSGINSYWGYDQFYYSNWYSPFYFNFGFGNRWQNNYYGWYGRSHYRDWNDFRPGYYSHNDRYGNNYNSGRFSHSVYPSRHNSGSNSESVRHGNIARREGPSVNSSRNSYSNHNLTNRSNNNNNTRNAETRRNGFNNGNLTNRSGNGISNAETRRYSYAPVNHNNSSNRNLGNSISSVNAGRINGSGYTGRSISSSRAVSAPQIHSSSSRSFSSGSGSKSISSHSSSHSSSKSSGSGSHSSRGRSSGRR